MKKVITIGRFDYGEISDTAMFSAGLKEVQYALKKANNVFIDQNSGVKRRPGSKYIADGDIAKRYNLSNNVYFKNAVILGTINDVNSISDVNDCPNNTAAYLEEYNKTSSILSSICITLQFNRLCYGNIHSYSNLQIMGLTTSIHLERILVGDSINRFHRTTGEANYFVSPLDKPKSMCILNSANLYHSIDGYPTPSKMSGIAVNNFCRLTEITTSVTFDVAVCFFVTPATGSFIDLVLIEIENLTYHKDRFIGTKEGKLYGFNSLNYEPIPKPMYFPRTTDVFNIVESFTAGETINEDGTTGIARTYYTPMSGFILSPLGDNDVNFNWLNSGRYLTAGTNRGLWIMSKEQESVTIDNAYMKNVSKTGTSSTNVLFKGDFIYYFSTDKRNLMKGKFVQGEFVSESKNILAFHIFHESLPVKMVTIDYGLTYIFVLKEDGTIAVYHESYNSEFYGWSTLTIDGDIVDIFNSGNQIILRTKRISSSSEIEYYELIDLRNETTFIDCFIESKSPYYPYTEYIDVRNTTLPSIRESRYLTVNKNYKLRAGLLYNYEKIVFKYTGATSSFNPDIIDPTKLYMYIIGGERLLDDLKAPYSRRNFIEGSLNSFDLKLNYGLITGVAGLDSFKSVFNDTFKNNYPDSNILLCENTKGLTQEEFEFQLIGDIYSLRTYVEVEVVDVWVNNGALLENVYANAITTEGFYASYLGYSYETSIKPRLFYNLYNGNKSRIHSIIPVVINTAGLDYIVDNGDIISSTFNSEYGEEFTGLGERTMLSMSLQSVPEIEIVAPPGGSMNITSMFLEVE